MRQSESGQTKTFYLWIFLHFAKRRKKKDFSHIFTQKNLADKYLNSCCSNYSKLEWFHSLTRAYFDIKMLCFFVWLRFNKTFQDCCEIIRVLRDAICNRPSLFSASLIWLHPSHFNWFLRHCVPLIVFSLLLSVPIQSASPTWDPRSIRMWQNICSS